MYSQLSWLSYRYSVIQPLLSAWTTLTNEQASLQIPTLFDQVFIHRDRPPKHIYRSGISLNPLSSPLDPMHFFL